MKRERKKRESKKRERADNEARKKECGRETGIAVLTLYLEGPGRSVVTCLASCPCTTQREDDRREK